MFRHMAVTVNRTETRRTHSMIRTFLALAAALALPAAAQDYPNKPIRILVGYAAGGGNDIIVRVMTNEMSKGLGQPVIVENKPGASNYASSAGIFQITTEMFKQRTGSAIEMIPYKSSGESVHALIGHQVM